METPIENTAAPSVDVPRLVLPLPDSLGWWWCRAKDGYLPGDELCVEVSEVWIGGAIVHFGRDHDMIRPADHAEGITGWFYDMEWIKVSNPWQNSIYS
jgi:hypothetical protein